MSTMTAAQIADLHARRTRKGAGYAPALAECLDAAREGRLWDVDTASSGEDGLSVGVDRNDVLAEWAEQCGEDETPARWTATRITLAA